MRYFIFIILFLWGPFVAAHAFFCRVIDDSGQEIILSHPAKRIISLAPDLTENLFAIGAGQEIVGTIAGSDYPNAAQGIPIVAYYHYLNMEAILNAHPDLIVAWKDTSIARALRHFKVPVYLNQPERVIDVPKMQKKLGCLTGKTIEAEKSAALFLEKYRKLQQTYARKKKVTVFMQIWASPFMTISKTSWINDVIQLCGGQNIFANALGRAPTVDLEAILLARPQVIISTDGLYDWQKKARYWERPPIVRPATSDWLERAGPRLMLGAEQICKIIDLAR